MATSDEEQEEGAEEDEGEEQEAGDGEASEDGQSSEEDSEGSEAEEEPGESEAEEAEDAGLEASGEEEASEVEEAEEPGGAEEPEEEEGAAPDPGALSPFDSDVAVASGPTAGHAAYLSCNAAPFAGKIGNGNDVWAYVPDGRTELTILSFFHGNGGHVKVDSAGGPPGAVGNKYALGAAAEAYKHPVVFAPQVAEDTGKLAPGSPAGSNRALGDFISDGLEHLHNLDRPTGGGAKYLSKLYSTDNVRRLYLAGHSAGGRPLAPAALSALAFSVPTDLWLLDCTYPGSFQAGAKDEVLQFCDHWSGKGKLGADIAQSRVVMVFRPYTGSVASANQIIADLKAYSPLVQDVAADNNDNGTAALSAAQESKVRAALTSTASVVVFRTLADHDHLPTLFVPLLLECSAGVGP
jgi:hypothetical protein